MSNPYRGPSIYRCFLSSFDSFGKVVSEEKVFRNRQIRNKNCLWRPYLLTDQDEMSNHHRGPSIDTSYQDLVHLAKLFQKKANRRQMPSDGKSSHGLWTGELKYD